MNLTVICPKHGEHEYAIEASIPNHEGVWCQICWLESLGPSLPYRKVADDHQTMAEANPPEEGWTTYDKNSPTE